MTRDEINQTVATEIEPQLREVIRRVVEHKSALAEDGENFLLPGEARLRRQALEREETNAFTPAQRVARAHELDDVQTIERQPSVINATVRARNSQFAAIGPALKHMAYAGHAAYTALLAHVTETERQFFEQFGLPREETSATRMVLAEKAKLSALENHFDIIQRQSVRADYYLAEFPIESLAFLLDATKS